MLKKRKTVRKPRNGIVWNSHGVILEMDWNFVSIFPTWPEQNPPIKAFPFEARRLAKKLIAYAEWAESREPRSPSEEGV